MDAHEIAEEYEKEEGYEDVVRMLREDARRVGSGLGAKHRGKGISKPVTTRTNTRFLGNLLRSQDRHNQRVERVQKGTFRGLDKEYTRLRDREQSGDQDNQDKKDNHREQDQQNKRQVAYSSHCDRDRLTSKGKDRSVTEHNLDPPEPIKPKKPIVAQDKHNQSPRGHRPSSRPTINNQKRRESLGG